MLDLLDSCLADLREEMGRTDNHTYKQMLKDRAPLLKKLLAALQQGVEGKAQTA